jgi:hypothetical protein
MLINTSMQTNEENNKPGPKPKQLVEKTVLGIPVGRGNTKEVVPPEEVYKLAAIGCTDIEIAAFFGITESTLRYNFSDYLSKGREYVKTRLRMNMFRAADNLQPAILIFLAKNILGMSDTGYAQSQDALPWTDDEPTNTIDDDLEDIEDEQLTDTRNDTNQ